MNAPNLLLWGVILITSAALNFGFAVAFLVTATRAL